MVTQPLAPNYFRWKIRCPSLKYQMINFTPSFLPRCSAWDLVSGKLINNSFNTCTLHPVSGVTPSSVTITLLRWMGPNNIEIKTLFWLEFGPHVVFKWEHRDLMNTEKDAEKKLQGKTIMGDSARSTWENQPRIAMSEDPWGTLCRGGIASQSYAPGWEARKAGEERSMPK